jgi:alanine-glyoxylate transaminase/serine-glyoxylate transaminase/serine-pyruvate transaminase
VDGMEERLLLIPGPTNLPRRVREAMSGPQLPHVGSEFYDRFKEIVSLSRLVFRNEKGFQFVFTGTGTTGMESSVVSLLSHGDRSLVLSTGYFGKRFYILNQIHRARVDLIDHRDGQHADPDQLRKVLRKKKYKAVFMTHVDTSTSVQNPVSELVAECRNAGVYSVVDSVCGIGGVELDFDRLGADIVFTASQKALAAPPGAVLIAASREAMEYMESRKDKIESYYMNLMRWKPVMEDPKIYLATPAVQVLLALREALLIVKEEGLERRWERHRRLAEIVHGRLEALGIRLVAEEGYRANTVTSFWVKDGTAGDFAKAILREHNIVVARGLYENRDKMVRIGHFGILTPDILSRAMDSVEQTLLKVGSVQQQASALAKRRAKR